MIKSSTYEGDTELTDGNNKATIRSSMNECLRCPLNDGPVERPSMYTCPCALSGLIADELEFIFEAQTEAGWYERESERKAEHESTLSADELQHLRDNEGDYEKMPCCTPAESDFFEAEMNRYAVEHMRARIRNICLHGHVQWHDEAPGQLHLFPDIHTHDNEDSKQ
jgi:hypothetical protein